MKTINELLDEIEQRADKATEGPWFKGSWSGQCHLQHVHGRGYCVYDFEKFDSGCVSSDVVKNMEIIGQKLRPETADFIAHARTDVPKLVKALRLCVNRLALDRDAAMETKDEDAHSWAIRGLIDIAAILSEP